MLGSGMSQEVQAGYMKYVGKQPRAEHFLCVFRTLSFCATLMAAVVTLVYCEFSAPLLLVSTL